MKIYQLHLNGKERAHHDFKSVEEALNHQKRLIVYCKDRISEGQLGYRKYLEEAKNLKLIEIERVVRTKIYSVCEYSPKTSGIVRHFYNRDAAEKYLKELNFDSERHYDIMESKIND